MAAVIFITNDPLPQAKRDSESRLMEKLEKERSLNHELTAAKESDQSKVLSVQQLMDEQKKVLATKEEENQSLQEEMKSLKETNQQLKTRAEDLENKVEKSAKDLNELREAEIELMTQVSEKNEEIETNATEKKELKEYFTGEINGLRGERDQLLQELSVAQQNIAELIGAKKEGVVIAKAHARSNNQDPPTLPPTQENYVDKSAYDALQQAFEDIEEQYHKGVEEITQLRSRLHDMKRQYDTSQVKVAELTRRIQKCTEEYKVKCKDLYSAERQLKDGTHSSLQAKLQDMEENQEQVTKSWEQAIEELASRKEEIKRRDMNIAELENKVATLDETLHVLQVEYEDFQDKHDKVIQDKTAKMDQQEATLASKQAQMKDLHLAFTTLNKEKEKLQETVDSLRDQLGTLKRQTTRSLHDRSCPVCNTKFPARISQVDFEKHVQGHFQH